MKITDIKEQKNTSRANIYIDDNFAFGISYEIVYKYNLEIGMEIINEFIEDVLKAEEQNKGNDYAMMLLSYRWRTEKEIRDKMHEKGYDVDLINSTIDYLYEQQLLDDNRFAEAFTRDKINLNKWGSYKIKQELLLKGVEDNVIDNVLEIYCSDEYERALELGKKKIKSYKDEDRNKIYRKLGGYLQRRGYPYNCVINVLRELVK